MTRECITHHICDCREEYLKALEKVVATLKRRNDPGELCYYCDRGYDDMPCTCWDEMDKDRVNQEEFKSALRALDALEVN